MLSSFLFTLGVALIIYGLVGGGLYFPIFGFGLTDQFRGTAILATSLLAVAFAFGGRKLSVNWNVVLLSPLLLLLSHNQFSGKTFFSHYFNYSELLIFFALFCLIDVKLNKFCKVVFTLTVLCCGVNFFNQVRDSLIFSDDLPSFLYRMHIVNSSNPFWPSYDPSWNLGQLWTDIYATAAAVPSMLFLILSPLGLETGFNSIVLLINFVIPPFVIYLSCKILRLSGTSTSLACLLTLVSSTLLYRWGLKYGTLGYLTTSSFAILAGIILVKKIQFVRLSIAERFLLYLSIAIASFWPLNLLCIAWPSFLAFLKANLKEKVLLTLCALAPVVFVFHGLSYSEHFRGWLGGEPAFVRAEPKEIFRNVTLALNPIILFLLPFVISFAKKSIRPLVINYLIVGVVIGPFFQKLELHRVVGQVAIISSIPIAMVISSLWSKLNVTVRAFTLSLISVSCLQIVLLAGNQSFEKFSVLESSFKRFIEWSKSLEQPRFFFTGHILHQFSGGHIAPLPLFTGNEFVAMWPTHRSWTPQDPVPEEVRGSPNRLRNFFKAVCADFIIADRRYWKRRLSRLAKRWEFKRVFQFNRFSVYKMSVPCAYPRSSIKASLNEILIQNDELKPNLIVPYQYSDLLQVSGCERITPHKVFYYKFIRLEDCSSSKITIKAIGQ